MYCLEMVSLTYLHQKFFSKADERLMVYNWKTLIDIWDF
jgi:hypothetical protein